MYRLERPAHQQDMVTALHQMQQEGFTTDLTITSGTSSLHAHSALLCLASPMLATLLSTTTSPTTLLLPDTSPTVLPALLEFLYTGQCWVEGGILVELVILGHSLGLREDSLPMLPPDSTPSTTNPNSDKFSELNRKIQTEDKPGLIKLKGEILGLFKEKFGLVVTDQQVEEERQDGKIDIMSNFEESHEELKVSREERRADKEKSPEELQGENPEVKVEDEDEPWCNFSAPIQSGKKVKTQCEIEPKLCVMRVLYKKHNMKQHIQTKHRASVYECKDCGKRFSSEKGLKRHHIVHTQQKMECPLGCGALVTAASFWYLGRHFDGAEHLTGHLLKSLCGGVFF